MPDSSIVTLAKALQGMARVFELAAAGVASLAEGAKEWAVREDLALWQRYYEAGVPYGWLRRDMEHWRDEETVRLLGRIKSA